MKKLICAVALAMVFSAVRPSHAASLIGTNVTGSMNINGYGATNFFDSAYGYVPAGYSNSKGATTVAVTDATEFAFQYYSDKVTANVTSNTITLTNTTGQGNWASDYYFTDSAFTGMTLSVLSQSNLFSYSLSGSTLHISEAAVADSGKCGSDPSYAISLQFNSPVTAVTPEPSSLALLGTGVVAMGGMLRRRLLA